uniref:Kinase n=1 Tax=Clastoptera arizonana TaxID=38151 RepID=A0A1B6E8J3_9HEMI
MEDCEENQHNLIYLQPFIHQVGGHSSMLCLDDSTVCKPVVEREQRFYETIPDTLRSFAPQYHGIVKVFLLQENDYISLAAVKPSKYKPKSTSSLKRLKFRKSGSIEVEGIDAIFDEDPIINGMDHNNEATTTMNPWVLKCHKQYLANIAAEIEAQKSPLRILKIALLVFSIFFTTNLRFDIWCLYHI